MVAIADEIALAYFAERVDLEQPLATTPAGDLYLACGCAHHEPAALQALEAVLSSVPRWVARFSSDPHFIAELTQRVRDKLLVSAPGQPAKIAQYAGRSALRVWIRAICCNLAIDLLRDDAARGASETALVVDELSDARTPELLWLRARHRAEIERAFEAALAELTPRERTLLRLSAVDGLTVAQIGQLYGFSAATASRRLKSIRETILDVATRRLEREMALPGAELRSLLRVVRSQLHLSLDRLLAPAPRR